MEQYQKQDIVDISKHIKTLLHLPMVTREPQGSSSWQPIGFYLLDYNEITPEPVEQPWRIKVNVSHARRRIDRTTT